MKKSYIVDSTCNGMRLDRWLRLKIAKIPQGLVEKYLRTGKIKLNRKIIVQIKTGNIVLFPVSLILVIGLKPLPG